MSDSQYSKVHAFSIDRDEDAFEENGPSNLGDWWFQTNNLSKYKYLWSCDVHSHRRRHSLLSVLFLCGMSMSSMLSYIPFALLMGVVLNLMDRWYLCTPIAGLLLIFQVLTWRIMSRASIKPEQDGGGGRDGNFSSSSSSSSSSWLYVVSIWPEMTSEETVWKKRPTIIVLIVIIELLAITCMPIYYHMALIPTVHDGIRDFFTDVDGTLSLEWYQTVVKIENISKWGEVCGLLYIFSLVMGFGAIITSYKGLSNIEGGDVERQGLGLVEEEGQVGRLRVSVETTSINTASARATSLLEFMRKTLKISLLCSVSVMILCLLSVWAFIVPHSISSSSKEGVHCDPMDTTECMLPFPSSYYTIEDIETTTGVRVNIKGGLKRCAICFSGKDKYFLLFWNRIKMMRFAPCSRAKALQIQIFSMTWMDLVLVDLFYSI